MYSTLENSLLFFTREPCEDAKGKMGEKFIIFRISLYPRDVTKSLVPRADLDIKIDVWREF